MLQLYNCCSILTTRCFVCYGNHVRSRAVSVGSSDLGLAEQGTLLKTRAEQPPRS